MIIALTAPLLLSYPNPVPSQGGDSDIVAYRRLTYSLLAVGEGALGTVLLAQYGCISHVLRVEPLCTNNRRADTHRVIAGSRTTSS